MKNSGSLLLDQTEQGEKLPAGRGRIAWMCEIKDFDDTVSILKEKGHEPISQEEEVSGKRIISFYDPEGNPFYLVADK